MKQFADLTQEEREDFEQALDLAIDLAAAPIRKSERPVSVPDLYRYARSTAHGRNGLVRKAILRDARINRQWASIMARMSGAQFETAAAAAGLQDRIILQDERSGRRIELTRSDSDPGIAILMVDVGTSPASVPHRLSVWTSVAVYEVELPQPHMGICQLDLSYDGELAELFRQHDVKAEVW
ncbi:hypothetical protein HAD_06060 [Hyphomonas adhaerens MHS-3]|uniref:Uncharacterized protein n=1 Tax=Hyphomonas adhaerens MHS-3 TaxID=1280949 RepID=A0A069E574_9PROT|nr:hypothetical protein [Hyphomonas adhaerens]KCZ85223.1 hypothetical protein HAD_06060 [Hyphomonas adhaerens MHS-3]